MAIFCNKCGTSNENGAGFCDNCGAPLRAAIAKIPDIDLTRKSPDSTMSAASSGQATNLKSKKIVYAVAASAAVLILGVGATYFMMQPPAATASALLAAAKTGYGKETTDQFKRELCTSNLNYSESKLNAGENDRRIQDWLNLLVKAGLYNAPVAVNSGGLFAQTLLQYVATPELEKYRQGNKLCAASGVELAAVTDIEKPVEESLSQNGKPPKVLLVKSKLLLKSVNTAPWMETTDVREAFMTTISGWEYKENVLQRKIQEVFGLKDNKWTTGVAYKETLEKQIKSGQRESDGKNDRENSVAAKGNTGGVGAMFSNMFSFGHPLKGTWRMAEQDVMGLGVKVPAGTGPDLTFTSDAMESMGQSTSVDFSVDGKRVKVTPKGQSQSLVFVIEGPDVIVAQALGNMRYERVK